jgi:uncharacterized membrane protein YwzB
MEDIMDENIGLKNEKEKYTDMEAPKNMRMTLMQRAVFGFIAEVSLQKNYFYTDNYLNNLCVRENDTAKKFGSASLIGIIISLLAIATTENSLDEVNYYGLYIANLNYITQFFIFLLGVIVMVVVIFILDMLAISSMRHRIFFDATSSENPNMRMLEWKGDLAWLDAVLIKQICYQSSVMHRIIQILSLVWSIAIPLTIIVLFISGQIICTLSLRELNETNFEKFLKYSGLIISFFSIFIFVSLTMIPFKFSRE